MIRLHNNQTRRKERKNVIKIYMTKFCIYFRFYFREMLIFLSFFFLKDMEIFMLFFSISQELEEKDSGMCFALFETRNLFSM